MRPTPLGLVLLVAAGCQAEIDDFLPDPVWSPGVRYAASAAPRGFVEARGLIHAHSVYSHDACDDAPVVDGVRDATCWQDFRDGLCDSLHDFVFLTDHPSDFEDNEFPDVLLYAPDLGDTLVDHGAGPVAAWSACPDGHRALSLAGSEGDAMPVGLDGHVPVAERPLAYHSAEPAALARLQAQGAVVLFAHTESQSVSQLSAPNVDGFEMFNMHANALLGAVEALALLVALDDPEATLPHPDVAILPVISEDERYLDMWRRVLAGGARRVTTMGSDCHRNTFPALLADGERIDSYRRMMNAFSNHLLVQPAADGTWDDRHLEEALRQGRLWGAFEIMGHPEGFDYRAALGDGTTAEMGAAVELAAVTELVLDVPAVHRLDPAAPAPELRGRILRAGDSEWEEVAAGEGTVRFTPTQPGAYRAVIDMVPHHLRSYLGDFAERVLSGPRPWIYANPIYLR